MTGKRVKSRTRIPADWQPDEAGREYAAQQGVPETEVEAFRDYHLAHGSLMADWVAAWRTWCRNAVTYGKATGKPIPPPLVLAFDAADPWGVIAWCATLRDTKMEHEGDGKLVQALRGYPIIPLAREICEAAGFAESARPDLEMLAQWIRDGLEPDSVIEVIRSHRKPDRPVLRYFDARVRERARKAA